MSHHFTKTLLAAGATLLIGQAGAMAQPPEHAGQSDRASEQSGQPPGQAGKDNAAHGQAADPRERYSDRERQTSRYHISTRERMYIQDWYQRNLPPGLAKQGKVPPGHAKRLERGSSWPPRDMEYERLPRELRQQLSPLPDHLDYYRVGPDVVIADTAGNVVSDIVYDILN